MKIFQIILSTLMLILVLGGLLMLKVSPLFYTIFGIIVVSCWYLMVKYIVYYHDEVKETKPWYDEIQNDKPYINKEQ